MGWQLSSVHALGAGDDDAERVVAVEVAHDAGAEDPARIGELDVHVDARRAVAVEQQPDQLADVDESPSRSSAANAAAATPARRSVSRSSHSKPISNERVAGRVGLVDALVEEARQRLRAR